MPRAGHVPSARRPWWRERCPCASGPGLCRGTLLSSGNRRRGYTQVNPTGENAMLQSGRVVFSHMEEVLFGQPAAPAIAELAKDAQHVFLMVSGTLNRETDEIDKVRRALGNRC